MKLLCVLLCLVVFVSALRLPSEDAFLYNKFPSSSCNAAGLKNIESGGSITFTVNVGYDGEYHAVLEHTKCPSNCPLANIFPLQTHVNGKFERYMELYQSSCGPHFCTFVTVSLRSGLNTIRFSDTSDTNGCVSSIVALEVDKALPKATRGATLSYVLLEAEDANYTGLLIGPNRTYMSLPSEASGRMAVQLHNSSDFVEFTVPIPSNAVVIRFSIPDSIDGFGLNSSLLLFANNKFLQAPNISSYYSWQYGTGGNFTKNPSDGEPRHFYDDVRVSFGTTLDMGTAFCIQGGPEPSGLVFTIDLVEFHNVPAPYAPPSNSIDITAFGADPSGANDSTKAIQDAVNKAANTGVVVWIPVGNFTISTPIYVNNVTMRGAGPWYSIIQGWNIGINGGERGQNIQLLDFAVAGQTRSRHTTTLADSPIGGAMGESLIQNVWTWHGRCGMWFIGPFQGLLITGCYIRNTWADGINLNSGINNTLVEQTTIRNTGDDCLAMWAMAPWPYQNVSFRFNTAQLPILANTFAMYGGANNSITDNQGFDTVNFGSGLQIATAFNSVPIEGTCTFARNDLIRTGSTGYEDPSEFGAIWFNPTDMSINGSVFVNDTYIYDSTYAALLFFPPSKYVAYAVIEYITINKTGTYAIQAVTPGNATFSYVVAENVGSYGVWDCGQFTIFQGPGNSGWNSTHC